MFIGHYAIALGSKRLPNPPSLAVMFMAVQFLDLLWPVFVLLGMESFRIEEGNTQLTPLAFTHYPYSHSLVMALIWSLLFGAIYLRVTGNRRNAAWVGGLVLSHWVLDFLAHGPDLPLTPFGDVKVGLGMWNYPLAEITLEIGLFLAGIYLCIKAQQYQRKVVFWSLIGFLLIIHVVNLLGPAPPNETAVTWTANLMWIFVIWAWWAENIPRRIRSNLQR